MMYHLIHLTWMYWYAEYVARRRLYGFQYIDGKELFIKWISVSSELRNWPNDSRKIQCLRLILNRCCVVNFGGHCVLSLPKKKQPFHRIVHFGRNYSWKFFFTGLARPISLLLLTLKIFIENGITCQPNCGHSCVEMKV